jgi:predicted transcriptional regulator
MRVTHKTVWTTDDKQTALLTLDPTDNSLFVNAGRLTRAELKELWQACADCLAVMDAAAAAANERRN